MEKHLIKLIAAVMLVAVGVTIIMVGTYAWFTLSTAPETEGLYIAIGGTKAIQVAPDVTEILDEAVYHYPGTFSNTLNFSADENYQWLGSLSGLTPVSTADGLHWYLPAYNTLEDGGEIKDVSAFAQDTTLTYANITDGATEQGSYIYLDFWVVAPEDDYQLRVSTSTSGEDDSGSFVICLPEVIETESGLTIVEGNQQAAACARVGFLVEQSAVEDGSLALYQNNAGRYASLKGNYQEKGSDLPQGPTQFTIYEPNGDLHPGDSSQNGNYLVTEPLGSETPVYNLTVQKRTGWSDFAMLEQHFHAWITGKSLTAAEAEEAFHSDFLLPQITYYVAQGSFIENTSALYAAADANGAAQLAGLETGGATEDATIATLEANVPQRIRMFLWLEGQDVDCTNEAIGTNMAINIELAGKNA